MFDPYHKWLGIPKDQRPPTYYQLLGITQGEEDVEVIEEAAIRQTTHVRAYQIGPHAKECTQLLNEISQARSTLTNPAKRKQYDATLPQKSKTKLAGMPGPANQVTAVAPGPKVEMFADLEATELIPAGKKPLAKAAPAGSNKTLLYLGAGGGVVAVLAIVLVIALSGGGKDNNQQAQADKNKPKEKLNQKKNNDKNLKKDGIVKNKEKINKEKENDDKKGGEVKNPGDKALAAKFMGRYQMNYQELGNPQHKGKAVWEFTEDRAIQDGRDRGTWHIKGGAIIVTYSQEGLGEAILQFKGDNMLEGTHRQKNGQVFQWLLLRDGAVAVAPAEGNGLVVKEEIDCSKEPRSFAVGKSFRLDRDWRLSFEVAVPDMEIERRLLLSWGEGKEKKGPLLVEQEGKFIRVILIDGTNPKQWSGSGVEMVPAMVGKWIPIQFDYQLSTGSISLDLGGGTKRKWILPLEKPKLNGPVPLWVGGHPGSQRFQGRIRNVRLENVGAAVAGKKIEIPIVAGPSPLDKLDPEKIAVEDRLEKIPELVAVLKGPKSAIFGIAFSPDSKKLACACDEGQLYYWDLSDGNTADGMPLGPMGGSLSSLAFSADGKKLATANNRLARVYDATLPEPKGIREINLNVGMYPGVAWSPDGNTLAVTDNGGVRLLDWIQDKELHFLKGFGGQVRSVAYSRDGKRLVAAGWDGKGGRITVWDLSNGPPAFKFSQNNDRDPMWHAAISPDGKRVAYGSMLGFVHVLEENEKFNLKWGQKGHRQWANSVCFAPDSKSLISTEGGGNPQGPHYLIWWNAENGDVLKKWELPERCSQGVFAPSGMYVALTNHNHKVYILRLKGD